MLHFYSNGAGWVKGDSHLSALPVLTSVLPNANLGRYLDIFGRVKLGVVVVWTQRTTE